MNASIAFKNAYMPRGYPAIHKGVEAALFSLTDGRIVSSSLYSFNSVNRGSYECN